MGHLHVSKMKFRYPVPDTFSPRKSNHNEPKRTIMDIPANTSADFQVNFLSLLLAATCYLAIFIKKNLFF